MHHICKGSMVKHRTFCVRFPWVVRTHRVSVLPYMGLSDCLIESNAVCRRLSGETLEFQLGIAFYKYNVTVKSWHRRTVCHTRTGLIPDSESAGDKVVSVDGREKTRVDNQMWWLHFICLDVETVPKRQHIEKQTTGKMLRGAWFECEQFQNSGTRRTVHTSCLVKQMHTANFTKPISWAEVDHGENDIWIIDAIDYILSNFEQVWVKIRYHRNCGEG